MSADSEAIGRRLREAREAAGLSRSQVAERLGVHFTTVQHHESGKNELRPKSAVAYARLYKVALTWLLTGQPGSDDIARLWEDIPPDSRPAARQMLEALAAPKKRAS